MKRMAWSLVVTSLVAAQGWANDPAGGAAPPVEPVIEVKVDPVLGDPVVGEPVLVVCPVDGVEHCELHHDDVVADNQILMMSATGGIADTGVVDENLQIRTMTLGGEIPANFRGGEEELSMNTAALGLPGLGDGRINLNAFGLFGEHRDSMRLARDGQAVTTKKVGLLQLFGRNKAKSPEPTVKTVSTVERARAQKLAEIDKLRDEALRTGDRTKLAQADKLEAQLNAAPAKAPSKFNPFRK